MGKRKKTGVAYKKHNSQKYQNDKTDEGASLLNPDDRSFVYDEVDEFEDERDRLALDRAKRLMAKQNESHEQVLGIDASSEEDDDNDDDSDEEEEEEDSDEDNLFMEDDIVDEPEFKLPDERAWGKNKRRYLGTDTSDEKILKKMHTDDEELAKLEEETARKLQERMAAELQDFVADDLIPQEEDTKKVNDGIMGSKVKVDLSRMSRAERLKLLQTESPEFIPLIDDLKEKCEDLCSFLAPLMEGVKMGEITSSPVCQYITTKYRLVLNYVCVLSMYMVTKCNQGNVSDHPVISRLAQYRQLLQELVPCDDKLQTQLKNLIPRIISAKTARVDTTQSAVKDKPRKGKELRLLSRRDVTKVDKKRKLSDLLEDSELLDDDEHPAVEMYEKKNEAEDSSDEDLKVNESNEEEETEPLDPDGKRAINYQIAKNKGLLPSRKKEQRNPRVKYRNKYKTKLKKRKGQVREVRREMKRYEGEVSGIRSHTIKSIKIK